VQILGRLAGTELMWECSGIKMQWSGRVSGMEVAKGRQKLWHGFSRGMDDAVPVTMQWPGRGSGLEEAMCHGRGSIVDEAVALKREWYERGSGMEEPVAWSRYWHKIFWERGMSGMGDEVAG
jgi:hypothetical protein